MTESPSALTMLLSRHTKRREFIAGLGSTVAWPVVARAQQRMPMRRIGVLMTNAADDPVGAAQNAAFAQGLQQLGWMIGVNVRVDYRWGASEADLRRKFAAAASRFGSILADVALTKIKSLM